jgi:hypothetical protein
MKYNPEMAAREATWGAIDRPCHDEQRGCVRGVIRVELIDCGRHVIRSAIVESKIEQYDVCMHI